MRGRQARLDRLAEYYEQADTVDELAQATAALADAPGVPERMTTFAVRLPVPVLERVREIAGQRGVTTSAVIRGWIDAGLASDELAAEDRVVAVEDLLALIGKARRVG